MFKKSSKNLASTKYLAIMAIFIALKIAVGTFYIPVADNLRIYSTFIFSAVEAAIIGPIPALVSGLIGDLLGVIIRPSGPFFPGYTLSSMLGLFIYAIFLYDTKITWLKIVGAKFVVNLFVNAFLGSIWSTLMFSKGFIFYFNASLLKNTLLLPIEFIMLVLIFNVIGPSLKKKQLISSQNVFPLPWF